MAIRLSKAAIADLKEIRRYIAEDDPKAANRVVARIKKSIDLIAEKPDIGRPTPQRDTREWSIPGLPYLIPYRMIVSGIEVVRVWHTSRNRPDAW